MLPGKMDRRHTSITGRAKAYSARPACGYSVRVPCGATSPFARQAGASDPVSIVTSHEEEDWGTEPVVPDPPAKPLSPRNP
jgi:hypothetical protein